MPFSIDEAYGGGAAPLSEAPPPARSGLGTIPFEAVMTDPPKSAAEKKQNDLLAIAAERRRKDVGPKQMAMLDEEAAKVAGTVPPAKASSGGFTLDEAYGGPAKKAKVEEPSPLGFAIETMKNVGGEAAALADLILSTPGFILGTGAKVGATAVGLAAGEGKKAYASGQEIGGKVTESLTNPLAKLLKMFESGKAYEDSKTTAGMEAISHWVERAGQWVEAKTAGRIPAESVGMMVDTLMTAGAGAGARAADASRVKGKVRADYAEGLKKGPQPPMTPPEAPSITPEAAVEIRTQGPQRTAQQTVDASLGIRTEAEQKAYISQRRADVKAAFKADESVHGQGDYFAYLSQMAEERVNNRAMQEQFATPAEAKAKGILDELAPPAEEVPSTPKTRIAEPPIIGETPPILDGALEKLRGGRLWDMTAEEKIAARGMRVGNAGLFDSGGKPIKPSTAAVLAALGVGAAWASDPEGWQDNVALGLGAMGGIGAIKAKGGMWHPEAVKRLAEPLGNRARLPAEDIGFEGAAEAMNAPEVHWAYKAVKNYLNKHAGTEGDPLAGVEIPFGEGTAKWGELTDKFLQSAPAKYFSDIKGVPLDEPIWGAETGIANMLRNETRRETDTRLAASKAITSHLSHVGDYLRQNVDPGKLPQYDLVRAVKETAANDARVAREMEKAAQAATAQLPVVKDYGDGYKWVELKLPEVLTEEQGRSVRKASKREAEDFGTEAGIDAMQFDGPEHSIGTDYIALDANGKPIKNSYTESVATGSTPQEAWLAGRLAEEGNQMGHCVGGYCADVASGASKIYSLRGPKGERHVTVEVEPKAGSQKWGDGQGNVNFGTEEKPVWRSAADAPDNITQIKGKQNRAPASTYLPYVQDFVKSGKWGEVGDLDNAGMVEHKGQRMTTAEAKAAIEADPTILGDDKASALSYLRQRGSADPRLLGALAATATGAIAGSLVAENPAEGAILGALGLGLGATQVGRAKRLLGEAAEGLDKGLGMLSTRIGNISRPLLRRMDEFERSDMTRKYVELRKVAPAMQAMKELKGPVREAFDNAYLNNDRAKLEAIIEGVPELRAAWPEVRKSLDAFAAELGEHGRLKKVREDYLPRLVKDRPGLLKALGSEERGKIEKELSAAETSKLRQSGTPLTQVEEAAIINKVLQQEFHGSPTPGFAKGRRIAEVTKALQPFYYTPSESLYAYVNAAVTDLEKAKFFGKDLVNTKVDGATHINLDLSIGNVVARELEAGKIDSSQAIQLEKLLRARFVGERSTPRRLQDFMNVTNAALLGNPVSASVQLGDAGMAWYHQDLRSAITAAARIATGNKRVEMADFGLANHISEEFVNSQRSARFLQGALKWSGFAAIDSFGKNMNLNAAWDRATAGVKTESGRARLKKEYGEYFGDEFPAFLDELRSGERGSLADAYLWRELSDAQPISKLETPQARLENPHARLLYQLKSFTLKQVDIARRDVYQEFKSGNTKQAIYNMTKLATVLGLAGIATDAAKDFILGHPIDVEAGDVAGNILKTFGWSQYMTNKAASGHPVEAAVGVVVPPYKVIDDIIRADPKAISYIPIVGKLAYEHLMGGKERSEIKTWQRKKREGRDPGDLSDSAQEELARLKADRRDKRIRKAEQLMERQ